MTEWYSDHRNLAKLARHMIAEGDDVDGVLYMLESPWKYEPEWRSLGGGILGEIERAKARLASVPPHARMTIRRYPDA